MASDIDCSNEKGVDLWSGLSVGAPPTGRSSVPHNVSNDEFDESYNVQVSTSQRSQHGLCLKYPYKGCGGVKDYAPPF